MVEILPFFSMVDPMQDHWTESVLRGCLGARKPSNDGES